MRYFTPELLKRLASSNDDVADAADKEWERAIGLARRRWRSIRRAFPEGVQVFEDEGICLHDARVVSVARRGDTLVLILEKEPPAKEVVLLTFTLIGEPFIDPEAVPGHGDG